MHKIDATTARRAAQNAGPPRAYIGASSIGDPCQAYLALSLRGFYNDAPSPQLSRIFEDGHRIERIVVDMLLDAGMRLREVDPATGKQYHFDMLGGHLAANLDGMIFGEGFEFKATHTLEVKSMNRKLFESFVKKGVAISHPSYVDQAVLGMGLSGIHACLLVAYCKDNAKLHAEVIEYDPVRFIELTGRASSAMFARQAERTESWDCNGCFKRTACKTGIAPPPEERHCRHCRHSIPDTVNPGKKWICTLHARNDVSTPCADFEPYRAVTTAKPAAKPAAQKGAKK